MSTNSSDDVRSDRSIRPESMGRHQVEFSDGSRGRAYYHDALDMEYPSVSTVLNYREDPEKDDVLEWWRNKYDGSNRHPHWLDQKVFKQHRGTLAHYELGNAFGDVPWTDDEAESEERLTNWWAWAPSSYSWMPVDDESEIPTDAFESPSCSRNVYENGVVSDYYERRRCGYETHEVALDGDDEIGIDGLDPSIGDRSVISSTTNTHRGNDAYRHAMNGVDAIMERVGEIKDELDYERTIDTETYVRDDEWGYAGQFDLLYEDSDGNTVLGDFKTSSNLYYSHKLQAAGYANALDRDIDRFVVIRVSPDNYVPSNVELEVSFDDEWEMSKDGLTAEFVSLVERTQTKVLSRAVSEHGVFYDA